MKPNPIHIPVYFEFSQGRQPTGKPPEGVSEKDLDAAALRIASKNGDSGVLARLERDKKAGRL